MQKGTPGTAKIPPLCRITTKSHTVIYHFHCKPIIFWKKSENGGAFGTIQEGFTDFLGARGSPSKNMTFTVLFVDFFHELAENVPPALKSVPALLRNSNVSKGTNVSKYLHHLHFAPLANVKSVATCNWKLWTMPLVCYCWPLMFLKLSRNYKQDVESCG